MADRAVLEQIIRNERKQVSPFARHPRHACMHARTQARTRARAHRREQMIRNECEQVSPAFETLGTHAHKHTVSPVPETTDTHAHARAYAHTRA